MMLFRNHVSTSGNELFDFGVNIRLYGIHIAMGNVANSPFYVYKGETTAIGGRICGILFDNVTMTGDKRYLNLYLPYPIEGKTFYIYDPNSASNATLWYMNV